MLLESRANTAGIHGIGRDASLQMEEEATQ